MSSSWQSRSIDSPHCRQEKEAPNLSCDKQTKEKIKRKVWTVISRRIWLNCQTRKRKRISISETETGRKMRTRSLVYSTKWICDSAIITREAPLRTLSPATKQVKVKAICGKSLEICAQRSMIRSRRGARQRRKTRLPELISHLVDSFILPPAPLTPRPFTGRQTRAKHGIIHRRKWALF